ncbi:MAG: PH domain-containing protein [Verrucomicrobia bacterium]|nr:PH domain-containing protein [Verrucomicrobiota bacterium]
MNPITFECPHCHEPNVGDESMYGQRVECRKCRVTILIPPAPVVSTQPQTARLIPEPPATAAPGLEEAVPETEIFRLSPVARAYPGQILLGLILIGVAAGLAVRAQDFSWPHWVALAPLALGLLVLLLVWIRVKSSSYRLTNQRLFVRRGWWSRQVNELELYRVKDVVVHQRSLQRLLGYGTIKVLADDDTTPEVDLVRVSRPMKVKEMIRTQYRAARQREGVQPTEFMQSP